MLSDTELSELLMDVESDRSERKASISDKDKLCEAICAFANDLPDHQQPGVAFVGANNDGSCAKLLITDHLLLTLSAIRDDGNILPLPAMTVQKKIISGCELAVIEVQPSSSPPVRYRGRTYIRVGPRRAIATREEEQRLSEKRRSLDLPFDHQSVSGATPDDLDLELFTRVYLPAALPADVISENNRTMEQQLASLHFLSPDGTPNVAGILTLGKDPRSWIPAAYVQFVRFDGKELTDPILHQDELSGPLPDLLDQLDRLMKSQIAVSILIEESGADIKVPDYPLTALTQISRNAVLHRNYESSNAPIRIYWFNDRVEIHSPGGPYGQVTPENFSTPGVTDYRNPLLAEAMKTLGHVQRFGYGFPSARKSLIDNGNPELETLAEATAVLVILRSRS
ncbi:MAG: putative DNA binding domain-containing protein [Planctomycetaceae bacterium]|nr:putative DNA binding domain-containing protein [Planctomycetaceae bacterium]